MLILPRLKRLIDPRLFYASYAPSLKATRMTAVQTVLDAQTNPAQLVIFGASYSPTLAIIILQKPSFTLLNGVLTLNGVPLSAVALASGTAALAQFQDGAGTWWIEALTVGTTGTDVVINSVTVTQGQTVTVTAAAITAAP